MQIKNIDNMQWKDLHPKPILTSERLKQHNISGNEMENTNKQLQLA